MAFDSSLTSRPLIPTLLAQWGWDYDMRGTTLVPTIIVNNVESSAYEFVASTPLPYLDNGYDLQSTLSLPTIEATYINDWSVDTTFPFPRLDTNLLIGESYLVEANSLRPRLVSELLVGLIFDHAGTTPKPVVYAEYDAAVFYNVNKTLSIPTVSSDYYIYVEFFLNSSPRIPMLVSVSSLDAYLQAGQTARLSATLTPDDQPSSDRSTWIMNMATHGFGTYINYNFNSFFRVGRNYYGCASDGVYLLGGATDDGSPIACRVKTGITDFGIPKHKLIDDVYVYGRTAGDASVTLLSNENEKRSNYTLTADDNLGIHRRRVKTNKGIRGMAWQATVDNQGGQELAVESVEVRTRYGKRAI